MDEKKDSIHASCKDDNESGEELFCRFLSGDVEAFEAIVSLYEDELSRYIYRIVGDYHEAKQLTIEAFGELSVGGKKYTREKSSLKTYLFTIGKNLTKRYMRRRQKHDYISFDEIAGVLSDESETPYAYMEREESRRMLHAAISELKKEHNTVLSLLYFEDMSYRQAGELMNKSEKQITQLVYRAKMALRKKLENMTFPNA